MRQVARPQVKAQPLLDYLFEQPILSIPMIQQRLGCGYPTACKYVAQLVSDGLLREMTGFQRNRRYRFDPYLNLFESNELATTMPPDDAESEPRHQP